MAGKRTLSSVPYGIFVLFVSGLIGCSQGTPVVPGMAPHPDMTLQADSTPGGHQLWGEYLIVGADIEDEYGNVTGVDLSILPLRSSEVHANVTAFVTPPKCTNCVTIQPVKFKPGDPNSEITATVFLKNPTALTGYDVRGIIYPPAQMAKLETLEGEARYDGFTTLYNQGMPETVNPYMAFNKATLLRPFGPGATHGESYIFTKNNAYKLFQMVYKIDASYPTNAGEAVGAYIPPIDGPIHPEGSNAMILAVIRDWQNNVDSVKLDLTGFGGSAETPMVKISQNPANYVSTWQYLLTGGGGNPAGKRSIRMTVNDAVETLKYYYDIKVDVTYDANPPIWKVSGQEGIYDHIAGPEFIWLFFHEAWDVSLPLQYIFYGSSTSPAFNGSVLKVVTNEQYVGYTPFGAAGGAPSNQKRFYSIRLKDAQGWEDDNTLEYSCTRFSTVARWSFIKDQPAGQDGILGSPAIGDINNDGKKDIVLGARNHIVYVYGGSGTGTQNTIIWEYNTGAEVQCTPALVDLNNDSKLEVVIASDNCNVYALNGATGLPLWTYDAGDGFLMHASPSIAYLNGDSVPDVAIGTGGGYMVALNGTNGSELWKYPQGTPGGGIQGGAAVADVTGDSIADVCYGAYDTKVHMVNGATGKKIWEYYVGPGMYNVDCSPTLADVNGDSVPDCIIGARNNVGQTTGAVFAINGATGDEIWIQGEIWGTPRRGPAPAQIDGDGVWDFIITAYQTETFSIYALSGANGSIIYQKIGPNIDPDTPTNYSSPIIGDFTGDGHLNAIYGREDGFCDIVNIGDLNLPGGFAGKILFSMQVSSGTKQEIFATPAVADVDGDGEWEFIACNMRGYTYIIDMHAPVPTDISLRGWTQQSGNRWNTGTPEFEPPK